MDEKERLIEYVDELKDKLYNEILFFWKYKNNIDTKKMFIINSTVISSLIPEIIYPMFKKDCPEEILFDYIDKMCEQSKKRLILAMNNINENMN